MPSSPRPARRPLAVLVAVLALAAAGCSRVVDGTPQAAAPSITGFPSAPNTPTPSTSDGPAASQAQFQDCGRLLTLPGVTIPKDLEPKLSAECASVPVPLDYANPDAGEIKVVAVRIHDSDNPGDTPLFLNPGGPGGSGLELALGLLAKISPSLLAHYDLLGFDPRGVGLSAPINCLSDAQKDVYTAASPDVTTTSGFAAAKQQAQQFATACLSKAPDSLQFYNTVNTAKDMDVLRQALGADSMNYLGFSYGTELGSVYAHLFPDKVNVAVLDGAVDPLTSGIEQSANQLQGFEDAFDQFAKTCPGAATCHGLTNARATAASVEAAAFADPLATSTSRKLTGSLSSTGILEGLYSKSSWGKLAAGLVSAKAGDGTGLLALADQYNQRSATGTYSNIIDSNVTIACNDSDPGPSDAEIRATAADWVREFPLFGKASATSLFNCQPWQPHRVVPPKPSADTPTKVLVVGNLHDPATPYQGAKDLTSAMGNAELLTWDGEGHTSYLSGSTCVDNYINTYLIEKKLPPQNTTCPA